MTMTAEQPFQLASQALGALPILGHFLDRLGLEQVLERHLPDDDPRVLMAAARTIKVLVLNLCVEREPLYGIGEWAERFEAVTLSLEPGEVALVCDDRVGRALDRLFDADRASLLTELTLRAIREFGVDCSQLHNDSTSITLHGEYLQADGRERGGQSTAAAKRGHNKEHRGDLKQLLLILTVSADGAVPLAHRLADGNVTDDQTHIETWTGCAFWSAAMTSCMSLTASCARASRWPTSISAPDGSSRCCRAHAQRTGGCASGSARTHPIGSRRVGGPASATLIPTWSGGSARRRSRPPRGTGSPGCTQAPSNTATRPLAPSGSTAPATRSQSCRSGWPARAPGSPLASPRRRPPPRC